MGGIYFRRAAKAVLIYCAATAAGLLTSVYFMKGGGFDGQSKDDNADNMWSDSPSVTHYARSANCSKPFVLSITVQLKPEVRQQWLHQWAKLAEHVLLNEPSLISYELLEVEDKPETFIVYERYCKKSDLHSIHQQSTPFQKFKGWCAENNPYIIKDGQGAYPTGLGHWTRA